jgi:hypothetical protein
MCIARKNGHGGSEEEKVENEVAQPSVGEHAHGPART